MGIVDIVLYNKFTILELVFKSSKDFQIYAAVLLYFLCLHTIKDAKSFLEFGITNLNQIFFWNKIKSSIAKVV